MKIPIWMVFKNISKEYLYSLQKMAKILGVVLEHHQNNPRSFDKKNYVVVKTRVLFDLVLEAINPIYRKAMFIHMDYNNLPMKRR